MATSDWDFGQKLIEKGFCTLDQVREALSIQDRMKQMGVVPKPLPEILVEKGYVSDEQIASAGGTARKPAPRPSAPARPSAARRIRKKKSVAPLFALAALAGVVLMGLFFGGDIIDALSAGDGPPVENSPVPEGPTSAETADREAREALDRVAAFADGAEDFENGAEVLRRYGEYMKAHRGKKWELEAQNRLKAYRDRADGFARPKLEAILARDAELRAEDRLGELMIVYRSFPKKFLDITEAGRIVRERMGALEAKVRETYVRDKAEVEKLGRAQKWEEALAKLRTMERYVPGDRLEEVGELKVRMERERYAASALLRREIADAYFKVDGKFKAAMATRNPRVAAAHVGRFLFADRPDKERAVVRQAKADYEKLRKALDDWDPEEVVRICHAAIPVVKPPGEDEPVIGPSKIRNVELPDRLTTSQTVILDLRSAALVALFLKDFGAGYQKAISSKESLDLPGLGKGHFEKRGRQTVYVLETGEMLRPDTHPIGDRDRVVLAMKGRPEDASHHARVGFFYYYCSRGRFILAHEHLKRARELGGKGLGPYLATLLPAAREERTRQLTIKFEAAEESFGKKQWVTARKLLEELVREYEDHEITKKNRPKIEKMLFEIHEGLEKERRLSDLYRAPVERIDAEKIRVTYDFEEREQIDAFELVSKEGERKFKGRWRIGRGVLESGFDASVLRWKTPVRGNVTVEVDVVPMEEPQNIVLDLFYSRGQGRHYAVVLGFDWVGRADGDTDNTAERRNGMPSTCVIKYPVSVDKSRWVLPDHWANWTSRLVGGTKKKWEAERRKKVRLKVQRLGRAIRVHADGTLVWEGEDGDYNEGDLLFYSDCRCRIDNLSIEFKP